VLEPANLSVPILKTPDKNEGLLKLKTQTTKANTNELEAFESRQQPQQEIEKDKQLSKLIVECDSMILQQKLISEIKRRREQIEHRKSRPRLAIK